MSIKSHKDSPAVTIVANFNRYDCKHEFSSERGKHQKVLDPADAAWAGPGSEGPSKTTIGDRQVMRPLSIVVPQVKVGEKE